MSRGDKLPTDTPKHTTNTDLLKRGGKNSPSPTRRQAQVPPNIKPTQTTGPTAPTDGKTKNKRGYVKHSKLDNMKKQRNIVQMKDQGKNPQHQINKEEIGQLPEKEFRVMTVKMIHNLENRMEKMQVI